MTFIMLCSWCNRILPIQGTCCLDEKELKKIVTKLVEQFMNNRQETGSTVKVNLGFRNFVVPANPKFSYMSITFSSSTFFLSITMN